MEDYLFDKCEVGEVWSDHEMQIAKLCIKVREKNNWSDLQSEVKQVLNR